jgi:2-polyprenyl-6-methoxyphenol hydroxylase-like FAD-dependent oxidoreductase
VLDYTDLSKVFFSLAGHQMLRTGAFRGIPPVFIPSRPLLECLVRRRVRETANITLLEGYDVVDLTSTTARDRVTGARVRSRDGGSERVLRADLVADATGRGARTPAFLDALGYGRPVEDQVAVRVAYSSQLLRIPPGTLKELMVLVGGPPGRPAGMACFGHEDDTWMFTVAGIAGREPPSEPAEMLAFAEGLAPAHVLAAIRAGEPLTEVCRFRYPESRWRRYDKMRRFPAGLLVFGDAICSFNPVYGQGMTMAALQAVALRRCLAARDDGDLSQRFFRATTRQIAPVWRGNWLNDFAVAPVTGWRSVPRRLLNWNVDKFMAAAQNDIAVTEAFARLLQMQDPATRLIRPSMVARVVAANLRLRAGARGRKVFGRPAALDEA